MRDTIINYLRVHPLLLNIFWKVAHYFFSAIGAFVPVKEKTILITSFAGRKYDDSPKALYEEILNRQYFDGWNIIWAFVDPESFEIPRGEKVRIDTWSFFMALLYSRIWISNSGMDRNLDIYRRKTIKIETWHGTPIKKIGGDQNSGVLGNYEPSKKIDKETIRCAQSEYDREILARVFNADIHSFLMSDLPRNDNLFHYSSEQIKDIKLRLGIPKEKKTILYMPTYREYLVNEKRQNYIAPPIDINEWQKKLGKDYVLLFRAHYAVNAALDLKENEFVKDVSAYPYINDLYIISDLLISDYSSAFVDFSILDKPMLCFAYDEEEYIEKRGLYIDLHCTLPCTVDTREEEVIDHIKNLDYKAASDASKQFHNRFAPYAGNASKKVIDELVERLETQGNNI